MKVITTVVYNDEEVSKHLPVAEGEKIAGSLVQLSTDATQTMTIGSDGGLLVSAVAQLPDDQILTGDPGGSVALTFIPDIQLNGAINYSVRGDIELSSMEDNIAELRHDRLYVPKTTFVQGNAPATTNNYITPTTFFGGNTTALGTPEGFFEVMIGNQKKLVPFYATNSGGGTPQVP